MGTMNRGSFKVNKVANRSSNNTKAYNQSLASRNNKFNFKETLKNSNNFKIGQKPHVEEK